MTCEILDAGTERMLTKNSELSEFARFFHSNQLEPDIQKSVIHFSSATRASAETSVRYRQTMLQLSHTARRPACSRWPQGRRPSSTAC